LENLINVFKTLSDKTRLRILSLLLNEELSVQEIVEIIGGAQSGISRHLSVLKSSGFIKDRKEGQNSYYSISLDADELKVVLLKKVSEETSKDEVFEDDLKKLPNVIQNRKETSRLFFESRAHMYDDLAKEYESEKIRVFSMLGLVPKGLNVLDLGCGTGRFLPFLASVKANIVAVDLSEKMLIRAKERMAGYPDVKFYVSDAGEVRVL
jgi:ArsR family transcriptional regulator